MIAQTNDRQTDDSSMIDIDSASKGASTLVDTEQ